MAQRRTHSNTEAPRRAHQIGRPLEIVISNSSGTPIYEQIATQIKEAIMKGELTEGQQLPSIRALASLARVSAITTKRAYEELEAQGFVNAMQGKGCFVAGGNAEVLREERLRGIERLLAQAVEESRALGIPAAELREMFELQVGDES